jgi:hypothetical protein
MWGMFMIAPVDVSFQNVLVKEGGGENIAPATLDSGIVNTMASYAGAYPNGHGFSATWMTPGSTEGLQPAYDAGYGTRMGIWDKIQSLSPGTPAEGRHADGHQGRPHRDQEMGRPKRTDRRRGRRLVAATRDSFTVGPDGVERGR